MKSFRALYLTAIVAITMKRCWAEFLLVEVNDDIGEGSRVNRTIKAQKIGELTKQGVCDIKPCCCDECYPCDYELIAEAQKLAEAKAHAPGCTCSGWCRHRCGHPLCRNCRRSTGSSRYDPSNNYGPMASDEVRKFKIPRKRKPDCKLQGDEIIEISVKKTVDPDDPGDMEFVVVKYEKKAFINCASGFIHYVQAAEDTEGCGIGTILTNLCFNEDKIHNVANNKENDAINSIHKWVKECEKKESCKGTDHQEELVKLEKWVNSECSRLINLYNKADPKNRAFMYFKSAMETGYNKMFIKKNHDDMYPKDDCRSVEVLKDRYNGNGEMVEGDIKVNVDEKYWFFCEPTTQPECK